MNPSSTRGGSNSGVVIPQGAATDRRLHHLWCHAGVFALAWALSRGWMVHHWYTTLPRSITDPTYYYEQLGEGGLSAGLREYPLPVVWLIDAVRLLVGNHREAFLVAWGVLMELVDLGFGLLLWRWSRARRRVPWGAWYWLVFGLALGPTLVWFRFDVLAGGLVGAACLLAGRRPGVSGALLALATWVKLWPALLVVALWRRGVAGRRLLASALATGGVIGVVALITGGWARTISPLTWQGDRGLQLESVAATGFVLAHDLLPGGDRWSLHRSRFHAWQVSGPGVSSALHLTSVAMLVVFGCAVAVAVGSWRRWDADRALLAALGLTCALLVADKTLSPQYLLWAGPVAAALLSEVLGDAAAQPGSITGDSAGAGVGRTPSGSVSLGRVAGMCAGLLGVAAVLTHVLYPDHYAALETGRPWAGWTLCARNLALVVVAVCATRRSLNQSSGASW